MNRKQRGTGAKKRRRKNADKTAEGGHDHASLADAWRHYQDGRLPPAEALCRELLEAEPDNPDANHLLGLIAHKAGHFAAAADLVGRAVAVWRSSLVRHHLFLVSWWGRSSAPYKSSRWPLSSFIDDFHRGLVCEHT